MKKYIFLSLLLFSGVALAQTQGQVLSNRQRTAVNDLIDDKLAYVNVRDHGAVGDSVTDDTDAFQSAINAGNKVYVSDGIYTLNTLVIPEEATLIFSNNAIINVIDTLTIQGTIEFTMSQIFKGVGYVNFSGMKDKRVYPEWWGVKTNGVDYSTQITKCVQDSVTLVFSAGVYTMYNVASGDVYNILPNDGVSYFTIEGNNTIIKAPNGIGSYSSFLFSTASHVTIRNIEFNGNRDNLTSVGHNCLYFANSEYITVENNYIHNYKDLADDPAVGGSGILLIESSQAIVRGNVIRGTDVAIYPIGLHDFTISNNKIYEGVSEAIALDVGFWTGKRNRRGIISDNLSTRAFTLNCASDVVVTGNTILEDNIAGLLIGLQAVGDSSFYADSCYAENIVASNNLIKHTVYIGYSLRPTVTPTKFYAKNVILSNNTIYPSVGGGIYILTGDNIEIKNNLITVDRDSVNSLIQSYPDSTYLKNISIENNTLRTNQDTVIYGIITSGYPLYIRNNIVTGNFTTGVYVLTQSDKLDSVYVSNNITSASLVSAYGTPNNMWDNIASNLTPGAQIFQDSYIFSNTLNIDTVTFNYNYAIVQVWGDTNIDSITTKPAGSVLHLKFQDTLLVENSVKNIKLRVTNPFNYRSSLLSTLTLISSGNYWWEFARTSDGSTIGVDDTAGVTDGYVAKYLGGEIIWSPDIATAGSGLFNPDGVTIDTTAGGLARVLPSKVTKWDSVTVKLNAADTLSLSNRINLKASLVITDSLAEDIAAIADSNFALSSEIPDTTSLSNRINLKLDIADTTAFRTFSDLKYSTSDVDSSVINDLIENYLTDSSYASSYTGEEIDKAIGNTLYSVIKVNPDSNTTFTLLRTKAEIVIDSVFALVQGTSALVDFNLAYGTDRTSGTNVFASSQSADNVTVGETFTTFSSATIPVNNMLWLNITNTDNTPEEFLCVIYYH